MKATEEPLQADKKKRENAQSAKNERKLRLYLFRMQLLAIKKPDDEKANT